MLVRTGKFRDEPIWRRARPTPSSDRSPTSRPGCGADRMSDTARTRHARTLFAGIAPEYERMGAVLSFGQDRAGVGSWSTGCARPRARGPRRGERYGAGRARRSQARGYRVTALDASEEMLGANTGRRVLGARGAAAVRRRRVRRADLHVPAPLRGRPRAPRSRSWPASSDRAGRSRRSSSRCRTQLGRTALALVHAVRDAGRGIGRLAGVGAHRPVPGPAIEDYWREHPLGRAARGVGRRRASAACARDGCPSARRRDLGRGSVTTRRIGRRSTRCRPGAGATT